MQSRKLKELIKEDRAEKEIYRSSQSCTKCSERARKKETSPNFKTFILENGFLFYLISCTVLSF